MTHQNLGAGNYFEPLYIKVENQGSQKDSPAKQANFHSHLPGEQGPKQIICQLKKKVNQNLRAASPEGKLEFVEI